MSGSADRAERSWSPVPAPGDEEDDLAHRLSRGFEPVTAGDWAMVVLAFLDVLLLVARDVYADFLPGQAETAIVVADLAILGIFAIEFLGELRQAAGKLAYVRNHWFDVVGLIPVAHWGIRIFRLVRLLRIYVVKTYPVERVPERDWSYALVRGLIGHYKSVLLEEITDPIVLASIGTIRGPMVRARWAASIGSSLEEHRDEIRAAVANSLEENPRVSVLARSRPGRALVREVTDATLDSVVHTLESDELNEVIGESVGEVLDELAERVREKEYRERGGTVFRPSYDY